MGGLLSSLSSSSSSHSLQQDTPPPPSSIVIVGASFAGLAATRILHHEKAHAQTHKNMKNSAYKGITITVVEPRDYFEYVPGILRAFVDPGLAEKLCVPLEE